MSKPKMKRHYSGNHSKQFWNRVGKVKNDTDHASVYFAGVLLQELEERVLVHLEQAEFQEPGLREREQAAARRVRGQRCLASIKSE